MIRLQAKWQLKISMPIVYNTLKEKIFEQHKNQYVTQN